MTAFLVPLPGTASQPPVKGQTDRYAVRWLNPVSEVWICGHATVALSAYLSSHHPQKAQAKGLKAGEKDKITLETVKYGTVSSLSVLDPFGNDHLTAIDFPELIDGKALDISTGRGAEIWDVIDQATTGWTKDDVLGLVEDDGRILIEVKPEVDLADAKIDCEKLVSSDEVSAGKLGTYQQDGLDPKYLVAFQVVKKNRNARSPHVNSRTWNTVKGFRVEESAVSQPPPLTVTRVITQVGAIFWIADNSMQTGSVHCAIIPYCLTTAQDRLYENHDARSFGLDPEMRYIFRVAQLSERGGEMYVCWNKDAKTVRIMAEACEIRSGEVDL